MNREDQEAVDLLTTLRDPEPGPTSGVSIDQAVRSGRRRVYTRRSAGVLTAITAVVAISVASTAIGNQIDSGPAAGPDGSRFGVMTEEFDVGSAGGYQPAAYETGEMQQQITLRAERPNGPLRGATGFVQLWPVGRPFEYDGSKELGAARPEPRLPGGKYYVLHASGSATIIAWEWTPGGWGLVRHFVPDDATPEDDLARAVHIAESVHRRPEPVRVPFTVKQAHLMYFTKLRSVTTWFDARGKRRDVILRWEAEDKTTGEQWTSLGVQKSTAQKQTNTTVHGRSALRTTTKLIIPNYGHGFEAVCEISSENQLDGIGWCDRATTSLQLVPNPRDERTWTEVPVP